MENLVAGNLFATTSGIAGRTTAPTRWSVSPIRWKLSYCSCMMMMIMITMAMIIMITMEKVSSTKTSGLQETEFNEYMLVGLGFGLASIVAIGMMIYCRKYK